MEYKTPSGETHNLSKDSRYIVPGDIIQVERESKFMCDAILLEGIIQDNIFLKDTAQ